VLAFGVGPGRPFAAGGERQREEQRKKDEAAAHGDDMLGPGED
jgi:hypothetical protein